jgi:hypothetical protein
VNRRTPLESVAVLVALVFLVLGILGFVPGVTTHYGSMGWAGHGSGAELLGLFQVSVLHNVIHLLYAVVGFAMARTMDGARTYLVGGGTVYLVLWLLGIVQAGGWIPVNTADNWLHFVFGIAMIGLGFVAARRAPRAVEA